MNLNRLLDEEPKFEVGFKIKGFDSYIHSIYLQEEVRQKFSGDFSFFGNDDSRWVYIIGNSEGKPYAIYTEECLLRYQLSEST